MEIGGAGDALRVDAQEVLRRIRAGTCKPMELGDEVRRFVLGRELRLLVTREDLLSLGALCTSGDDILAHLGCTVAGAISHHADAHEQLRRIWDDPRLGYDARVALQHALLHYPLVSARLQQGLFDFTASTQERWVDQVRRWYGGPERVHQRMVSSLNLCVVQPGQPQRDVPVERPLTMRWIFVCSLAACPQVAGARPLVERYAAAKDDLFLAAVAREVLCWMETGR